MGTMLFLILYTFFDFEREEIMPHLLQVASYTTPPNALTVYYIIL